MKKTEELEAGYKEKYFKEFGHELKLEDEIEKLGIEKVESGAVKIPKGLAEEIGIQPTITHDTDFHEATGFTIAGISLTDDQITAGKKKPISKSIRWLIEWFIMELLKGHYIVKFIRGKILRQKASS